MTSIPSPEQDHSIKPADGETKPAADTTRETPAFDYFAEARAHGKYLGLPQQEAESDFRYRDRIAGVLRDEGRIIEAHEVASGRRYDDPEQGDRGPMVGIVGALAQALAGHNYSPYDPERQVGDDIAAGVTATTPRDPGEETLARMFNLLGPATTMDILGAFQPPREK